MLLVLIISMFLVITPALKLQIYTPRLSDIAVMNSLGKTVILN